MGRSGTDVTKEAADMVLADDNFATIVTAVEEGRRIYDNIRRFVRYLLTTNSAEVGLMFLAPLIGMPIPLLPVQILWINLVTDGPPAIALGLEPAEPDVLRRPPRPPEQSIVSGGLWLHALVTGAAMAAVTVAVQVAARAAHWRWQTMVFTLLVFLQLAVEASRPPQFVPAPQPVGGRGGGGGCGGSTRARVRRSPSRRARHRIATSARDGDRVRCIGRGCHRSQDSHESASSSNSTERLNEATSRQP
jgi:hypothetical protein